MLLTLNVVTKVDEDDDEDEDEYDDDDDLVVVSVCGKNKGRDVWGERCRVRRDRLPALIRILMFLTNV